MNDLWNSVMIIFGILISIIIFFNCKMWIKEYRTFMNLTQSNSSNIRSAQVYPLPVPEVINDNLQIVQGIAVDEIDENLYIIDIH